MKKYLKNFDIVEQKMQVVLDKDSAKKFQSPVRGIEIMEIFGLEEGKEVGLIKKSIEEAILDGVIENTHQAAMGFLKDYIYLTKKLFPCQTTEQGILNTN